MAVIMEALTWLDGGQWKEKSRIEQSIAFGVHGRDNRTKEFLCQVNNCSFRSIWTLERQIQVSIHLDS